MNTNLSPMQLRILALFALKQSGGTFPETSLNDVLVENGINTLLLGEAVAELITSGHIVRYDDEKEPMLRLSDTGSVICEELKKDVPITVREKVSRSVMTETARLRTRISVECRTEEISGGYCVSASLSDDGIRLLSFGVYTPTKFLADQIADGFSKNPTETYQKIIMSLTEQENAGE